MEQAAKRSIPVGVLIGSSLMILLGAFTGLGAFLFAFGGGYYTIGSFLIAMVIGWLMAAILLLRRDRRAKTMVVFTATPALIFDFWKILVIHEVASVPFTAAAIVIVALVFSRPVKAWLNMEQVSARV